MPSGVRRLVNAKVLYHLLPGLPRAETYWGTLLERRLYGHMNPHLPSRTSGPRRPSPGFVPVARHRGPIRSQSVKPERVARQLFLSEGLSAPHTQPKNE